MEYVIKGDTPEFKNCLVYVCGKEIESANNVLNRILNHPTDNDKKVIRGHHNLRIEEVEDDECWWNFSCD